MPGFSRPQFLGASVIKLGTQIGWNNQGSALEATLVEDPTNGDSFNPGNVGGPVYFTLGSFTFNGLLTKYTKDKDRNGYPTYSVRVVDPRHLLDQCKIIISDYNRTTTGIYNLFNVFGYYENISYGSSELNDSGMPWELVRDGVTTICNSGYGSFGGPITYRSNTYTIDLSQLPSLPSYFRVGGRGQGLSLLDFIQICCDAANYDFFVTLVGTTVTLKTVARLNAYPLGTIGTMISSTFANQVERSSDGVEERDETTSVFLIGGDVNELYKVDPSNAYPFWGFDASGVIMYGSTSTKHAVFLADTGSTSGSPIYSYGPIKTYNLYIPEIGNITGNTTWQTNDLELQILLGLGGHRDTFISWCDYLSKVNRSLYTTINLSSERPLIQPPVAGPNTPNNVRNANPARLTEIQAASRGAIATTGPWRMRLVYDALFKYAKDYYGKKYALNIPAILRKVDTDTGVISFSHEVSDGGWVDATDPNDLLGLPAYASDLFQTQDGRYVSYVQFNAYNADLSRVNSANSLINGSGTSTNLYVKSRLHNQLYFDNSSNAFVVTEFEPVYDYPDSVVGISGVIGPMYISTGIYLQNSPGTITASGQAALNRLIANQPGGSIPLIIHPAARVPSGYEVPLKSNILTYGPWYAQGAAGRVVYEQDSSLVPWNYGSYTNLNLAGNAKAAQGISNIQVIEAGYVEVLGYPGYNLGDVIQTNGPNITNISIDFGERGVTTTYRFETYIPRYGQLGKYNVDRFKRLNIANTKAIAEGKSQLRIFGLNQTAEGEANSTLNLLNQMPAAINIRSPNNIIVAQSIVGQSGEYYPLVSTTTYDESLGLIPQIPRDYNAFTLGTWEQILSPYSIFTSSGVNMPRQYTPNISGVITGTTLTPWKDNNTGFATKVYTKGDYYQNINDYFSTGLPLPYSDNTPKRVFGLKGPVVLAGWGFDLYTGEITPSSTNYLTDARSWNVGPVDNLWDDYRKVWTSHDILKVRLNEDIVSNGSGDATVYNDNSSISTTITIYNITDNTLYNGMDILVGYVATSNKWYTLRQEKEFDTISYSGSPHFTAPDGYPVFNDYDKNLYVSDGIEWYKFCPCQTHILPSGGPPTPCQCQASGFYCVNFPGLVATSGSPYDGKCNDLATTGITVVATPNCTYEGTVGDLLTGIYTATLNVITDPTVQSYIHFQLANTHGYAVYYSGSLAGFNCSSNSFSLNRYAQTTDANIACSGWPASITFSRSGCSSGGGGGGGGGGGSGSVGSLLCCSGTTLPNSIFGTFSNCIGGLTSVPLDYNVSGPNGPGWYTGTHTAIGYGNLYFRLVCNNTLPSGYLLVGNCDGADVISQNVFPDSCSPLDIGGTLPPASDCCTGTGTFMITE